MIDCAGARRGLLACNPQSGHRCICLTTGRFIYTYLGTGVYAIYTTAGAFEDSWDHVYTKTCNKKGNVGKRNSEMPSCCVPLYNTQTKGT